ncbi:conjugal transfer protein TraL [Stenoxybacter acetivorans]|uniref:nucleotide-binding protein n=1 Tax=Stenoxybacter acetivorans TaxID=422441 RepID=UPI000566B9C9|nr:conjugal transfer protein TraL [Stenoxybacter acetivorans]
MQQAHFILQGKGGVGKSLVASILAQYLTQTFSGSLPVHCFDTDPVNQTFSRYKALNTQMVKILNQDDNIDSRLFDGLIEELLTAEGIAVIDNGAATFVPLVGYLKENGIIEFLEANGVHVICHVVVTGGQAMEDTFYGLAAVLHKLPVKVMVWSNEFFGAIEQNGKSLMDLKVMNDNHDRIVGVIRIPRRTADTFGKDIENMVSANLTFDEVEKTPEFGIMSRQRLLTVKRDLFTSLDQLSFSGNLL